MSSCNHKWMFDYVNTSGLETRLTQLSSVLHCEKCSVVKESKSGPMGETIKIPMKPAKPSKPPGSVFKGDPDNWEKEKDKIF